MNWNNPRAEERGSGTRVEPGFDLGGRNQILEIGPRNLRGMADRAGRRVTTSPGESIGAYVAFGSHDIGLGWSDNTLGQHEVYFQRFKVTGTPLGEPRRLTRTLAASLIPAIRSRGDRFGLLWNEYFARTPGHHDREARSQIAFTLIN